MKTRQYMIYGDVCESCKLITKRPPIFWSTTVSDSRQRGKINTFIYGLYRIIAKSEYWKIIKCWTNSIVESFKMYLQFWIENLIWKVWWNVFLYFQISEKVLVQWLGACRYSSILFYVFRYLKYNVEKKTLGFKLNYCFFVFENWLWINDNI